MSDESRNTWIRAGGDGAVTRIDTDTTDVSLATAACPAPMYPTVCLMVDTYTNEVVYAHVSACTVDTIH